MENRETTKLAGGVRLALPAEERFLGLACATAEQAAQTLGLGKGRALRLVLAVEEVLGHLLRNGTLREAVELTLLPRASGVEARLDFAAETLDLAGMNVTARQQACDLAAGEDFGDVGLLLAARSVDRFALDQPGPGRFRLILRQHKDYPRPPAPEKPRVPPRPPLAFTAAPEQDELSWAVAQAANFHPAYELAEWMDRPGMVADLVQGGELCAGLAQDSEGRACGLILWTPPGKGVVSFRGPYILAGEDRAAVAELLCDGMLAQVARSETKGVFTPAAVADLPRGQFESLGEVVYELPDGTRQSFEACHRHMAEDMGAAVWSCPRTETFLRAEYERHFLLRDIRLVTPQGGRIPERSLFGTEVRASRAEAVLTPLLNGTDAGENAVRHACCLHAEGVRNVFVHLDLALAWQAGLAETLMEHGFRPVLLHPLAGRSDVLVLRHEP